MMTQTGHGLTQAKLERALMSLAEEDQIIAQTIARIGMPRERVQAQGFAALLRIIVGQQLSVKAAASIWSKMQRELGDNLTPEIILAQDDASLRGLGLSGQKVRYARGLAESVAGGDLAIDNLPVLTDDAVLEAITALKGFGPWSAQMYMMFSLGRPDVWPAGDLAVRKAQFHMLGRPDDVDEKLSHELAERWRPHRSAVALLCWHYYANTPF